MPNSIGQIQQCTNPSPRDLASLILIFLFSQKLKRKSESLENMHFLSANNKISPYVQIKCDLLNLSKIVCLMSENLHCLFKRNWLWIVPWITCWALPYLTAEQSLAWNGLLARVPDRSIFPYHSDICVGFLPYFKIVTFFFSFFFPSFCHPLQLRLKMGTFRYLVLGNVKNEQPKHLLLTFHTLLKYVQIFCEAVHSGNSPKLWRRCSAAVCGMLWMKPLKANLSPYLISCKEKKVTLWNSFRAKAVHYIAEVHLYQVIVLRAWHPSASPGMLSQTFSSKAMSL